MAGPALRRYAALVAAATFLLLVAGGLVTSTGSGLSVPDWPRSFGVWMPPMEGGVLYEHGHRMIAGVVGAMIVALAVAATLAEPRCWVRRLAWTAAALVVVQAVLGGLTVLHGLPDPISVAHAGLAQIVFGLTVAVAIATSRGWARAGVERRLDGRTPSTVAIAVIAAVAIYLQILLGAVVRHAGAGLAIPDFPLAYGQLVPPLGSRPVALHFAHRVGAIVVAGLVGWAYLRVRSAHRDDPWLHRPAALLAGLVVVQIGLGGWTIWSTKAAGVATAHLATGALAWATALALALRAGRRLALAPEPVHPPAEPHAEPSAT